MSSYDVTITRRFDFKIVVSDKSGQFVIGTTRRRIKMKIAICVVLLAVIALSSAEECRSTSDCDHVTCPENNYQLDCHYRQCTCTQTSTSSGCKMPSDCSGSDCRFGWHCVDNKCRCGFGFGGGK